MRGDIGAAIGFESETRRPRCFGFVEKRSELRPFVVGDLRDVDDGNVDEGGGRLSVGRRQETPSFFCRLVEDVVYWNRSFLSG